MPVWLFLLNVVLVTRLPVLLRDKPIALWHLIAICAFQEAALLVVEPTYLVGALAISYVLIALVWLLIERKTPFEYGGRLIVLSLYVIAVGACCAPSTSIFFRGWVWQAAAFMELHFTPAEFVRHADWTEVNIVFLGLLLCIAEANLLVRCVVGQLHLEPEQQQQRQESATTEYNRGRVIGILERLIIFVLVLKGEYGALGFVIAAKSFARFKELDDRKFAEYFLVGTLASVSSAVAIALVSQAWTSLYAEDLLSEVLHSLRWQ